MRLVLSIGEKVLGMAPLDPKRSFEQDYIHAKMRLLKMIHLPRLSTEKPEPVFYIQIPSKMNKVMGE
jgi:hypothetical protein